MKETIITLRIAPEKVREIEAYRLSLANSGAGILSRSEAIRRLLDSALKESENEQPAG